ncbi:MAG: ATP-binding response regulator, partial [Candidatus Binatia bacterium]
TTTDPSGYTVLVIDDQEEALISLRLLLEREGHHVLTAASGAEALALFRPGQIHLVIVDYFMPRMSGEEVVQAIRRQDADVQILLQTGYSGEKPPREMLRTLDIQGYHDKSEGPEHLLLWVEVAFKACAHLKTVRETEQEVEESRLQLRRLSARLLHLQEEERRRISRELHDHLGQLLTALSLDVEWAQRHCPEDMPSLHKRLQETAWLAQEAVQATRELSASLRPGELSGVGLEAALRDYAADFARRSGVPVHFCSDVPEGSVAPETATNVYRIVQEALTNVARHAAATKVTIDLRHNGERELAVSVVDDGKGFDIVTVSDPQAVGLVGMQERARLVGGKLEVRSSPGAGTSVNLRVSTG